MATIEVTVPDIGDFDEVAVIELLVKPGDKVRFMVVQEAGKMIVTEIAPAKNTALDQNRTLISMKERSAARTSSNSVPTKHALSRLLLGLAKCESSRNKPGLIQVWLSWWAHNSPTHVS
mgnify:CR=1 FL=1